MTLRLPILPMSLAVLLFVTSCAPPSSSSGRSGRGGYEASFATPTPREARRAARQAEARRTMCKRTVAVTPPAYCADQSEVDGRKLACVGKFLAKKVCKAQMTGATADLGESEAMVVRYASGPACGIAVAHATGGNYTGEDLAVDVFKQGVSDLFGKGAGDVISYAQVAGCIGNVDAACADTRTETVPCDDETADRG